MHRTSALTIALLFVVTQGLVRTGALDFVSQRVIRASRGNPKLLLAVCLIIVGALSSFLNNTPVVVIFLSIATVLVSTAYPAMMAARAAVPSGQRRWSLPQPDGGD